MPTGSAFPPIADYGFLSDCETAALVAPSGNVEWLCLPRMDSPSVFGAMLDRDAGGFRLGPADMNVPAARRYLPGTMVLETSWETPTGWIVVRDVLLIGPWHHDDERSPTHRRAPTDYDAEHVLLRTVECVQRRGRDRARLRAGVRLRPARRPSGSTPARATTQARGDRRGHEHRAAADDRPAARLRGAARAARARCCRRATRAFAALSLERAPRRRRRYDEADGG